VMLGRPRLARRAIDRHNRGVSGHHKCLVITPRVGVCVLLVSACMIALCPAARADDSADGRRHAKRASHLSASGKCKQAIAEYDKALAVMHDPALLFNRGECHRKLGDVGAALEDYNQFLADLPKAPNRAEVEARIAELRNGPSPSAASGRAAPGPGRTGVDKGAANGKPVAPQPARPTAAAAGGPTVAPARAPFLGGVEGTGSLATGAPPTDRSAAGTELTLSNRVTTPASPAAGPTDDSLTRHSWFWIAIAAAAVGVGVGTYAILSQEHTSIPQSPLGNYKF
jgi:tetratricopeptide (TPR) repeat protein